MAYNPNLDIEITPVQQTAISTDLNNSKATLNGIADINLSNAERDHLNGIDNTRLPYVQRAVNEFAVAYPDLVSKRVTAARALKLFNSFLYLRELDGLLVEYQDRRGDLSDNIENILYEFMRDMYKTAQQYEGQLDGTDVVIAFLGELFAGQGTQNPTPPTP